MLHGEFVNTDTVVRLTNRDRNAPYHLGLRSITFALASGNTTVLKGSELSPRCYWAIVDIFREAGLPEGCLNLILHKPSDAAEITESLIAHPSVKKINFTGSSAVGKIIASSAGKHMKPVLMELGGKASAVVLADADLDVAAAETARGAFVNVRISNPYCLARSRQDTNFISTVRANLHVNRAHLSPFFHRRCIQRTITARDR